MTHNPKRRDDETRMTPMELQLYRLINQIAAEFDSGDPRITTAMNKLADARDAISDYVDNVTP